MFPCCRSRNTVGGPLRTCNCCDRCLYPSHAFGEWKHETQNTSVLFHAARSAARKMAKNTSCRGKTTETRGRPSRKHGNTVTQTPLAELETRKHRNTQTEAPKWKHETQKVRNTVRGRHSVDGCSGSPEDGTLLGSLFEFRRPSVVDKAPGGVILECRRTSMFVHRAVDDRRRRRTPLGHKPGRFS